MVSPQSETGTPEKWLNGGGEDGEGWMRGREGKEKGRGGEGRGVQVAINKYINIYLCIQKSVPSP